MKCTKCNSTNTYVKVEHNVIVAFICYDCGEEYFDESDLLEEPDTIKGGLFVDKVNNLINKLVDKYNYKSLPTELSKKVRAFYESQIPHICAYINDLYIATKGDVVIAYSPNRIVIGDYGAYFEIDPNNVIRENLVNKKGQEYRFKDPKYKNNVKYYWVCPKDTQDVKIYYQLKTVTYADYKPNMIYISVFDAGIKFDIYD